MYTIHLRQFGNLANKMIEYAFAKNLAHNLGQTAIIGTKLADWGIRDDDIDGEFIDNAQISISDSESLNLAAVVDNIRRYDSARIELKGFFQNYTLLPAIDVMNDLFPKIKIGDDLRFSDDTLVVNIRAGEILNGVPWYPLIPINFYKRLIEMTGMNPVFLGQIDDGAYGEELRHCFPDARFIRTNNPLHDFEAVRSAKHVCISVSTFSWLASYLSDAASIFFPVLGMLHPRLAQCYGKLVAQSQLAPYNDKRYRFFLFPLIYGSPERDLLDFYSRAGTIWREIPEAQLRHIQDRSPFVANIEPVQDVRRFRYTRSYLDAAKEIAEGLYWDPEQHFASIGRRRGYSTFASFHQSSMDLISQNKPANQSSSSQWSFHQIPQSDAAGAVDGNTVKAFGFHTAFEADPWWEIDLEDDYALDCINIYNRLGLDEIRTRAIPLCIEHRRQASPFTTEKVIYYDEDFSSDTGSNRPLQVRFEPPVIARYVRLTVKKKTWLHLAQVQIFGKKASSDAGL